MDNKTLEDLLKSTAQMMIICPELAEWHLADFTEILKYGCLDG